MNTLLQIQVKLLAAEANAMLKTLTESLKALQMAAARGGGLGAGLSGGLSSATTELTALGRLSERVSGQMTTQHLGILQMGKDMQWIGRQINFNFTIPLLLAGKQIFGWAIANEQAMTRVRKVYGGPVEDLAKLEKAFTALSDVYGVQKSDVASLAAEWAAAGAQGADLAKSVETSLKLAILGDYKKPIDTFKDLIAIQSAYKLSSGQLAGVLGILTAAADANAADLPDFVTGIAKAGGSANAAGVDIRHLAAMMAVLTPATGSASNAGNALKSVFSRLEAPTTSVIQKLKDMGISFYDSSYQTLNATQRLEKIATVYGAATDGQKAFIASTLGSLFQVSKLNVLLDDLNNKTGVYANTLKIIDPSLDNANIDASTRKIQTLLQSDPQQLKILVTNIKNLLADAVVPLIPLLIGVLTAIKQMVQWFVHLNPAIQKFAVGALLAVSAIGILAQAMGSAQLLFGTFLKFMIFMVSLLPGIGLEAEVAAGAIGTAGAATTAAIAGEAMAAAAAVAAGAAAVEAEVAASMAATISIAGAGGAELIVITEATASGMEVAAGGIAVLIPVAIAAAVAAAIALVIIFRDQIGRAIQDAVNWVISSFNLLPQGIQNALIAVLHVVESVIKSIIGWLSYLNPFARHSPSLVDNVTAGVDVIINQYKRLDGIGAIFSSAAADLAAFADATAGLQSRSQTKDRQETTETITKTSPGAGPATGAIYADIDKLKNLMGPVNDEIKVQELRLKPMKQAYDDAALAVENYTSMMKPFQDQLDATKTALDLAKSKLSEFANTNIIGMKAAADATWANTQEQNKLKLALLELGTAGEGYDKIVAKLALMNGEIDRLHATMTTLRNAGAGSDVLGVYQDQLGALEAQKAGLTSSAMQGEALTTQLAALQHQAEIMNLTNALQFDPLIKQIKDLADTTKELSFEEILKGITEQRGKVLDLTDAYTSQKTVVDDQKAQLDALVVTRDALKASYDTENKALDVLKANLKDYQDEIRSLEQALKDAVSAQSLLDSGAKGAKGAKSKGDGGFSQLTNQDLPPQLDSSASGLNLDELIKQWEDQAKKAFKFDPFGSLRKWWDRFYAWWTGTVVPLAKKIWDDITGVFKGDILQDVGSHFAGWSDKFKNAWKTVSGIFSDGAKAVWKEVSSFGKDIGKEIGSIGFIKDLENGFKSISKNIGGWLKEAWKEVSNFGKDIGKEFAKFKDLGKPLIEAIGHIWNAMKITFKLMVKEFEIVIKAIILVSEPILAVLREVFRVTWEIIKAVAMPIWNAIKDLVIVAIRVIHDTIKFVLDLINGHWGKVWGDMKKFAYDIWEGLKTIFGDAIAIVVGLFKGLFRGIKLVWDDVSGFIESLPGKILDFFKTAGTLLQDAGKAIIQGLFDGILFVAEHVWDWYKALSGVITGFLGDAIKWLYNKGSDIISGMLAGIVDAAKAVWTWYQNLSNTITGFLGDGLTWLYNHGVSILKGLLNGIVEGAKAVWTWYQNLSNTITGFLGDAVSWLWGKGVAILTGLLQGIVAGAEAVWTWYKGLSNTITSYIADALTWLYQHGVDILSGLLSGIVDGAKEVWKWLGKLGGWISDNIPNPGNILLSVGNAIIQGLWDGMQNIWKKVTGWFSSITSSIPSIFKSALGISSPSKVFTEIGSNTMLGFHNGLTSGWKDVQTQLKSMSADLPNSLDTTVLRKTVSTFTIAGGLTPTAQAPAQVDNSKHITVTMTGVTFPGITSGADAEKFLTNLEAMVG